MKKLIETALPLSKINARTISERTSAIGHPANMHMWWGRSPYFSSIAAITAALVDAPDSQEELKNRLERIEQSVYTEFGDKPVIFDPFSGCGGIPLAAQALGLPVIAGDLNPVAVMLTKATSEIPALFSNQKPVNPYSLIKEYRGSEGLAEDVQYYGEWLEKKAQEKLQKIYPNEPEGKTAAWIWARTVKCPNPACACKLPMASSFVINGKAGKETWVEPVVENGAIRFHLRTGKCPKEKETNKYGSYGAKFICPACGEITTDAYVKEQGLKHELGAQLMALVIDTPNGKVYKEPNVVQETAAMVPVPDDIPHGEIPDNAHWFGPPGFGIKEYADLFSPRQLTMLITFCKLLKELQDKVASDALAAGMSPEGGSLATGGAGALAYGQAISIYLTFVIDKMADRNSTVCSWNSSGGNPRATFGRQAIPMVWNYAEGNPFSSITGNFKTSLKNVVTSIAELPCGSRVDVYQGDAVAVTYPENCMICTELPYYKAIGYAHLSDFFYIWMRRSLKGIFPKLFNQMVISKDELSTVGQFYGRDLKECTQEYEKKMLRVLKKLYQASTKEYSALLFYEFHKEDANVLTATSADIEASPWEIMVTNMLKAGFSINAVWPMRSEAFSEKADGTRILIVARKVEKTEQTTRRAFINTMKRELPTKLDVLYSAGVDECDKVISGLGCGLSLFSRYKKIMNADGSDMNVHDALQLIYQELINYLHINTDDEEIEDSVHKGD
ncbi:DUF1156 domain-containing protein [Phascolarctobacterium succinatutens]|uniref:DUF1156 domain-containing protein n=1 Tax=Phascolarctobacterium succinatutens TaxID=626940 RepID=UPI0026EB165C|nr:DUF1156 domain-containing protein [Phascolarctobacterium succinatutens]